MVDIQEIMNCFPPMKTGNELILALEVLPEYDENICNENEATRLIALSNLYKIFIPSPMSTEIYCKLYLALLHSLQKKCTKTAIKQRYENHKRITQQAYNGIIGGADSFTIIGCSGIGKTSSINRAISIISENHIIEIKEPYMKIIPCLTVQCPFDSSVKGLLLEILRKVDEELNSNYYPSAVKSRTATTDMLIGLVSSVALNHIGLLIIDEIQNVVNSKNGKNLVGMLTQLINNSGISIGLIGTPEVSAYLEQGMQLARRSLGLQYGVIGYDNYFYNFCHKVLSYRYVKQRYDISDAMIQWLYEHSGGVISVVVSLVHDAQELAILGRKETLNIELLNEAYQKRLSLLHAYIKPQTRKNASKIEKSRFSIEEINTENVNQDIPSITTIAKQAKSENADVVTLLKKYYTVEEVSV